MNIKKSLANILIVGSICLIFSVSFGGIISFYNSKIDNFWIVKKLDLSLINKTFASLEYGEEKYRENEYEDKYKENEEENEENEDKNDDYKKANKTKTIINNNPKKNQEIKKTPISNNTQVIKKTPIKNNTQEIKKTPISNNSLVKEKIVNISNKLDNNTKSVNNISNIKKCKIVYDTITTASGKSIEQEREVCGIDLGKNTLVELNNDNKIFIKKEYGKLILSVDGKIISDSKKILAYEDFIKKLNKKISLYNELKKHINDGILYYKYEKKILIFTEFKKMVENKISYMKIKK